MVDTHKPKQTVGAKPAIVTVRRKERSLANQIIVGPHCLTADQPSPNGNDTGPTPYHLLMAALGTCTSMTITMYANHKQWPVENININLQHRKISVNSAEENASEKTILVDEIERTIEIGGPVSKAQRDRLLEIANKCPVAVTLGTEINIQTRIVDPEKSPSLEQKA